MRTHCVVGGVDTEHAIRDHGLHPERYLWINGAQRNDKSNKEMTGGKK